MAGPSRRVRLGCSMGASLRTITRRSTLPMHRRELLRHAGSAGALSGCTYLKLGSQSADFQRDLQYSH